MIKKIAQFFRRAYQRLLEIRDTPESVAGGAAIGVFWGFTPLFGLKTLLSIATAWLCRCSKLAAAIAVTLHDVALPFMPLLFRLEYIIGFWLLSHPHCLPPKLALSREVLEMHDWTTFFTWKTFVETTRPLLVGSIVLGVPFAGLAFILMRSTIRGIHARREKRHAALSDETGNAQLGRRFP